MMSTIATRMWRVAAAARLAGGRAARVQPPAALRCFAAKAPEVDDDPNRLGTSLEYGTGKELRELQAEEAGQVLYGREPVRGPFGTKDVPAVIPSGFHERIVGCVGPADDEHLPLYFLLTDGPMQKCIDCGQVFKLKHVEIEGYADQH